MNHYKQVQVELEVDGQEKAFDFDTAYEKHWKELFVIAYKFTGSREEAKDLVQEVFFTLLEHEYQQIIHMRAFLIQVLRFKCFNWLRNGKISQKHLSRFNHIVSVNATENTVNYSFALQYVQQAVQSLPCKLQEIFRLSRFDYLTNQEIAQKLNISPKTVENQITRALKKLKEAMND